MVHRFVRNLTGIQHTFVSQLQLPDKLFCMRGSARGSWEGRKEEKDSAGFYKVQVAEGGGGRWVTQTRQDAVEIAVEIPFEFCCLFPPRSSSNFELDLKIMNV